MSKKQTSIYFEENLIDIIKTRSDKENLKMNDFVVTSVEKQLLYPFFSWRHLQNYITIIKETHFPKNESLKRKALFYIMAYDGILTEYINSVYMIEGRNEIIELPDDLVDFLHPDFDLMEAGIELFNSGTINEMNEALEWLFMDTNEIQVVTNAFLIVKKVISIKDELYRFKEISSFPQLDSKKEYSVDTFEESLLYKQCNNCSKDLLKELLSFFREKGMNLKIKLGCKDAFTFTLNTLNDQRLSMVSLSNDLSSLRVAIYRLSSKARGSISLCNSKYDLEELVYDDLIAKYQDLLKK